MPGSLKNILTTENLRYAGARLWQEISGVAADYWKDGTGKTSDGSMPPAARAASASAPNASPTASTTAKNSPKVHLWHAQPGEISEKMWGHGYVTPCDEEITTRLIQPLGLSKDMSLLDLSAGLGGRLIRTTEATGVYITGLEPDPEIAARGMAMAVAAGRSKKIIIATYNPANLLLDRKYDCVISRETIYRVPDKSSFIKGIAAACKSAAQVSFTDYIVNPETRSNPAIAAWGEIEQGASPVSLLEMAELWAKVGINLRVHDDLTEFYKEEVKKGMERFAAFMASGVQPDPETKLAIKKRVKTWAYRMSAMNAGMKFYRFYGMR